MCDHLCFTMNNFPSLMKSSISPDKRLQAAWGCTYQEGSNGVVNAHNPLFDMDTGKVYP